MSVQGRDVIFRFDNSCNFRCCPKFKCCSATIEDDDHVFVSPDGTVSKFDRMKGGAKGSIQTLANIEQLLTRLAQDSGKVQEIVVAVEKQLNIRIDMKDARLINAQQVRRIEAIASPILRTNSEELRRRLEFMTIMPAPPSTPKRQSMVKQPSDLVRSPPMRDLHLEVLDEKEGDPFVVVSKRDP